MTGRRGARPLSLALSLGAPLVVVGASAMAISYATLIDVARVNGMPLPELFPVLIDVGTVACMVAAAEFRRRGIRGSWLAYLTFSALSALSVFANATHAIGAADLGATTTGVAVMIAATPPAALLAITDLVMRLVPDAAAEPDSLPTARAVSGSERRTVGPAPSRPKEALHRAQSRAPAAPPSAGPADEQGTDHVQPHATHASAENDVAERLRSAISAGAMPTGREVGAWMGGKSARTGQRYIAAFLEARNR